MDKKQFGKRLERLRKRSGKTQTEISRNFTFTQGLYSAYERGKNEPSLANVIQIADYYKMSLDELIERGFTPGQNSVAFEAPTEELSDLLEHVAMMLRVDDKRKAMKGMQNVLRTLRMLLSEDTKREDLIEAVLNLTRGTSWKKANSQEK